jgi:hypothetical protein
MLKANEKLQKIIKKEDVKSHDEKSIISRDKEIKVSIKELLIIVYEFSESQQNQQSWNRKASLSFEARM